MQSIDILLDTAREFLHQIAAFLPRLLLAVLVVLVGWLLAKTARFAVERGLRAINFNVLTERAGTDHFLRQAGMRGDTTTVFGLLAYCVVILAALIIACNGLGLTYITDLLDRAVLFVPKLLVSMLIVIFGSYCARFVGNAVSTYCLDAEIPDADMLGRVTRYLIMTFVVMIALSQVEIGGDIVQRTFLILLGGLVLALALAFGIGGRSWAAAMLQRWWPQHREDEELLSAVRRSTNAGSVPKARPAGSPDRNP
jgi:flagellar biosynthesis protein FliQ